MSAPAGSGGGGGGGRRPPKKGGRGRGGTSHDPHPGPPHRAGPPPPPSRGTGGTSHDTHVSPPHYGRNAPRAGPSGQRTALAWVIRRQQLLRRAGYGVAVDGVWGAQSQGAWQQFTRAVSGSTARLLKGSSPGVPPGYELHNGLLLTHAQARASTAIEAGRRAATQLNRSISAARNQHLAMLARADSTHAALGGASPRPSPAASAAAVAASQDANAGRAYADQMTRNTVAGVYGRAYGFNVINGSDLVAHGGTRLDLRKRAEMGALDVRTVSFLLQTGDLDPSKPNDAAAIQITLNQDRATRGEAPITVDGDWGVTTNAAFLNSYHHAQAEERTRAVATLKHDYFDTGLAQFATYRVLGHAITDPGKLLDLLQAGGAQAERISAQLANLTVAVQQRAALDEQRHLRAAELFARQHGHAPRSPLTDSNVRALLRNSGNPLDTALLTSATTAEYQANLAIRDAQARVRAGIIGDGPGGLPLLGAFVRGAATAAGTVLDGLNAISGAGESALHLVRAGDVYVAAGLRAAGTGGYRETISFDEAQDREAASWSEMPGWEQFVWEMAADPLNYVPGAAIRRAWRLGNIITGTTIERAIDVLDNVSRHLPEQIDVNLSSQLLHRAVFADTLTESGARAALRTTPTYHHLTDTAFYQRATVTRRVAVARARRITDAAVRLAVHAPTLPTVPGAAADGRAIARAIVKPHPAQAAVLDSFTRDEAASFGDAVMGHEDALRQLGGEYVQRVLSVPTSVYATFHRDGGTLSKFGAAIQAQLEEFASRSWLSREVMVDHLADPRLEGDAADSINAFTERYGSLKNIHSRDIRGLYHDVFGEDAVRAVWDNVGTWYASHPEPALIESYNTAVDLFRERTRAILDTLDDQLRAKWGNSIWQTDHLEGDAFTVLDDLLLADETGGHVATGITDLLGYDPAVAFQLTEAVKNPLYYLAGSERRLFTAAFKDKLVKIEVSRLATSLYRWAEMKGREDPSRLDFFTEQANRLVHERAAAVNARWKEIEPGKWGDTEAWIDAPWPHARSLQPDDVASLLDTPEHIDLPAPRGTGALDSSAALWDIADVIAHPQLNTITPDFPGATVAVPEATAKAIPYTTSLEEYQRQLAIARAKLAPKIYLDQGLIWYALREKQAMWARGVYFLTRTATAAWKHSVIALRPAAWVGNVLDNVVKILLAGAHDPRLYFNSKGESVFDHAGVRLLRHLLPQLDAMFGTNAAPQLDYALEKFLQTHPDQMRAIFGLHGIALPATVSDELAALGRYGLDNFDAVPANSVGRRLLDVFWDFGVSRPEGWTRRILYASTYRRVLEATGDEMIAVNAALDRVHQVLFDYSKLTVLDDALEPFAPFVFFWRNNAKVWATFAVEQPWFFHATDQAYEQHRDSNGDLPSWMRRYIDLSPVASIIDQPGLHWLADWMRDGSYFDPLNLTSFVQFYRFFKQSNSQLPPDKQGWAFISNLVDGLTSSGLGLGPLFRYSGEHAGIFNRWAWRDVFPQTGIIRAITSTDFFREHFGFGDQGFDPEIIFGDPIWASLFDQPTDSELSRDRFEYLVRQEMAGQAARGDTVNRDAAVRKIRGFIGFQALLGFAIRIFPRRISTGDLAIYQISNRIAGIYQQGGGSGDVAEFLSTLTDDQRAAYQIYRRRNPDEFPAMTPAGFDRWAASVVTAQAFFALDDWDQQQQFLAEHPEVLPIINPIVDGRRPTDDFLHTQTMLARQDALQSLYFDFLNTTTIDQAVRARAYDTLVTPSLEDFWRQNDTPLDRRDKMLRGAYLRHLNDVNSTYFALPENSEARSNFLSEHPEILLYWQQNDHASDDYRSVMLAANSTFRSIYFRLVDQGNWDAANTLLERHPFIFEFTKAEGRVDPHGHWVPKTQHARDYLKVKPFLDAFFALPDGPQRYAYYRSHPLLAWYFNKYSSGGSSSSSGTYHSGGMTQHARDYLSVKPLLDAFFALPEGAARNAFVAAHAELRWYFNKYASQRGTSAHARAYLAIKSVLDAFFALPEDKRRAFIDKHPELQRYFDKWGSHKHEAAIREAAADNPEIHARYQFWLAFFALPPHQRAEFVHTHAADAGIFIYGSLSYDQRVQQEAEWHRQAIRHGVTDKAWMYAAVKPLMDLFFTIKRASDKTLFLQTNPELQTYFDRYGKTLSDDPALNSLLEDYFHTQPYSSERKQFLIDHPDLRHYFDDKATPKQRAIFRQVDAYFQLPFERRQEYLLRHPELRNYFDQRKAEKTAYGNIAAAFNESDPRMVKYRKMYENIIPEDALHLWALYHQRAHPITQAPSREQAGRKPQLERGRQNDLTS